jgi:hypothetical protein
MKVIKDNKIFRSGGKRAMLYSGAFKFLSNQAITAKDIKKALKDFDSSIIVVDVMLTPPDKLYE